MEQEERQKESATTKLQFMAFRCGQLMGMITKLMQREDFSPMEQLTIDKANQQIEYAENLLTTITEK